MRASCGLGEEEEEDQVFVCTTGRTTFVFTVHRLDADVVDIAAAAAASGYIITTSCLSG